MTYLMDFQLTDLLTAFILRIRHECFLHRLRSQDSILLFYSCCCCCCYNLENTDQQLVWQIGRQLDGQINRVDWQLGNQLCSLIVGGQVNVSRQLRRQVGGQVNVSRQVGRQVGRWVGKCKQVVRKVGRWLNILLYGKERQEIRKKSKMYLIG